MAHNLNKTRRGVAFAYNQENGHPWHKLGTPVPGAMTTTEAIEYGKLDYFVEKQALVTVKGVACPGDFATVRLDTNEKLGIVGEDYTVVQNVDVFKFFDSAVGKNLAMIDTVGALGRGEVIFAVAKLPEVVEITDNDPIEHYLVLTNSHDGSRAIQVFFSAIRVVCQNTLMAAMRDAKNVISLKHTSGVEASLGQAHRLLETSASYWNHVREAYAWMARRQMKRVDVTEYLKQMFPASKKAVQAIKDASGKIVTAATVEEAVTRTENTRKAVLALFDGGQKGAELLGKTRWSMYNASTQWIDHERKSRTGIDPWQNSMFGGGATARQRSFDLLTDTMPRKYEDLVAANMN